jgi:hypothetical protein
MGRAIAVRTDYRSSDVRRIAQRVKNAAQARRGAPTQRIRFESSTSPSAPIDVVHLMEPTEYTIIPIMSSYQTGSTSAHYPPLHR